MKDAGGPRFIEHIKISLYFHGLGGVVKVAGDPGIIENINCSLYFLGCGVVNGASGPRIIANT